MRPPGFSELAATLTLVALAVAMLAGVAHVGHDIVVMLEVGERFVDGARPYIDHVDIQPPLARYMNAVVVVVGRGLGVSPIGAMQAATWLATLVACLALGVGGRPVFGERPAARAAAALAGATLFTAAVGHFAQRDHHFALLFTPWVVHRLRVEAGYGRPGWGVAAGVVGAVGVCIKPHFLVVALALEAFVVFRSRRRALEPGLLAFCLTGLLYPVHIALLPEDVREAWFDVWLPVIAGGYRTFGDAGLGFRTMAPLSLAVVLACVVGLFSPRSRGLAVVGVGALAEYALQTKGWYYHLIPALSWGGAAAAVAVAPWVEGVRGHAIRFVAGWSLLMSMLLLLRGNAVPDGGAAREAFARLLSPGEGALWLATELEPAYPWLELMGVDRVGTHPFLLTVPILYHEAHPEPFGPPDTRAEAVFRADLADDLATAPEWVMIDTHVPCNHCGPDVSVPRYLEDIGLLATIRRDYRLVEVVDGLELWRRSAP